MKAITKDDYIYYGQDEGSIYTKEGKERLWNEYNIVYNDGVFAMQIIPRDNMAPLIVLLNEEDEALFITKRDIQSFDSGWLEDLIELSKIVQNKIIKQSAGL